LRRDWSHLLRPASRGQHAEGAGIENGARADVPTGAPTDPAELSYWLGANLPLRDSSRQGLLACLSVGERLFLQARLMADSTGFNLLCRDCGEMIASAKEQFSLSAEGAVGTYVNPHGAVHQIITVRHVAPSVLFSGRPCTDACWFPGEQARGLALIYSWSPAGCAGAR